MVHYSTLNLIHLLALIIWEFFNEKNCGVRKYVWGQKVCFRTTKLFFSSFLISSRIFFLPRLKMKFIKFSLYSLKAVDTSNDFDVPQHLFGCLSDIDPQCCNIFQAQVFHQLKMVSFYHYICQQALIQINSIWTSTENVFLILLP